MSMRELARLFMSAQDGAEVTARLNDRAVTMKRVPAGTVDEFGIPKDNQYRIEVTIDGVKQQLSAAQLGTIGIAQLVGLTSKGE